MYWKTFSRILKTLLYCLLASSINNENSKAILVFLIWPVLPSLQTVGSFILSVLKSHRDLLKCTSASMLCGCFNLETWHSVLEIELVHSWFPLPILCLLFLEDHSPFLPPPPPLPRFFFFLIWIMDVLECCC